jgi:hypothetical protein
MSSIMRKCGKGMKRFISRFSSLHFDENRKKKSHSAFFIAAGCIESDPMNMTQFNSILYDKM